LSSEAVSVGFLAGGTYGSDLKFDTPGRGVGSAEALITAGGLLAGLRWGAEAGLGWGTVRRGINRQANEIPVVASGAIGVPLPFLGAEVSVEATGSGDLKRSSRPWDVLTLAGLSLDANPVARVHLAATTLRRKDEPMAFGVLVAVSGRLSLGDLDSDGIDDREDACPSIPGESTYQGCPLVDADRDQVWDRLDACPEEPGVPENAGCPLKDTDEDGLPDINDPCPAAVECPAKS